MTAEAGAGAAQPVGLTRRAVGEHPLTRTQSHIWTAQRLHPGVPLANMGKRHRITGDVDHGRLADAFDLVVRASDMLRSIVVDHRGQPALRILAESPAPTEIIDLPVDELDAWCAERIARPIDAAACAYDSVVIRHGPGDTTWWLDLHHVVTDAWSSAVVFRATETAYRQLGGDDGHDPVDLGLVPFVDHVEAVGARSSDEQRMARRELWHAEAARFGRPPPITPYGPRGSRTTAVERRRVPLGHAGEQSLRDALTGPYRTLSSELGLLGLLVTATVVALHRLDGRDRVSVGVPIHHRSGPRAPHVVGPLMELYPLRIEVEPGDTFGVLFQRVQRAIVELLRRARPGESPEPDFEVVVNVLTARYGTFDDLPTTTDWMRSGHVEPSHVVRVQAYDYDDELRIELDLNEGLSADGAHRALPDHLAALIAAAVADPESGLGDPEIVNDDERAELGLLNPPADHASIDEPVHLRIRRQLRARPDAVVAECEGEHLTAAELDRAADDTARRLGLQGVRSGDLVGLRMPRGLDVLVAVHGVLRAGAAFVMLDPEDPAARHESIAADAGLRTILDRLPDDPLGDDVPLAPDGHLDQLAYVLYTSGSTGPPKGVPIPHRGLADYLSFAIDAYVEPGAEIVMPLHSRLVFDLTITSLFLPTLVGGRIVVVPEDGVEGLARLATDESMTLLKATPSQLDLLVRMADRQLPLHTVVVGGEAFRRTVATTFADRCPPGVRIFNEYGPTEAVVGCMIHEFRPDVDAGADVPIGHASPGAEVFVLDRYGRRTPPGSWGELYVRRPGMPSGYLARPELSAERFRPVAGIDDRPLYRTGDRARVERPGVLVYGGRLDDQLKVGGIRLEPGEIEAALLAHPAIDHAVVRLWRRTGAPDRVRRCPRCGLGDDVPGVEFADDGVCAVCHRFDQVAPQAASWFRSPEDLDVRRRAARSRRRGAADCLHLLSGGKDSTYALYQLVEQGWDVHALTLDNGFISPGAIENISRTVADLGITHEFVTTEAMNDIFRDSLDRYANVCNGCYKTIYTLAIARAHELGIPVIVTGLSRGQFFETRLVPHQFEAERFDPDAIDATVLEARRVYHQTSDAVTESLPEQMVVERDDIFDEIEFVDFYRYVDVDLAELYDFLERRAPWVRPADTGRSTNCLVNDVGIWVHRRERGFHNYAEPYSWDVRLGHKTRAEALDELDDEIDDAAVHRMLAEIGYEPKIGGILTAWYQSNAGDIDADELRRHLRELLPEHAVPSALVRIDEIPMAASAKVDVQALPAPTRVHRGGTGYEPPQSPTEERVCELWISILDVDRVGATDDFFELGGASLDALETVARIDETMGVDLPDAAVFHHRTPRELAAEVDAVLSRRSAIGPTVTGITVTKGADTTSPIVRRDDLPLSPGQQALLFEYRTDPSTSRYGVTRRYEFETPIDAGRLRQAVFDVVEVHDTLRTTYATPRAQLGTAEAIEWSVVDGGTRLDELAERQAARPFDVDRGPLVRATLVEGDRPVLLLSMHHLWCDAGSFEVVWRDLTVAYEGGLVSAPPVRYSDHAAWQAERVTDEALEFWADLLEPVERSPRLDLVRPEVPEPDGYLRRHVAIPDAQMPAGSIFPSFLAAVDIALGAVSDDPVVVGVPMTVRDRPEVRDVVGYFLNTVALALPPVADVTFDDVRTGTESIVAAALRHRTAPYADVMGRRHRDGAATDLAAVMVVHDPPSTASLGGRPVPATTIFNGTAVTDLSFLVTETADGCAIAAEWSGARYGAADVARLVDLVGRVLAAGLAAPERPAVAAVERPGDERGASLSTDPAAATVVDRIWRHAVDQPHAPAVRQGADRLDWATLIERAETVAGRLCERDVRSGDRVALVLPPSVDQIVAILAVLRIGAAYVPVDPTYPAERIDVLLARSQPRTIIRSDDLTSMLGSQAPGAAAPGPMPTPDDPAYVIFTSATTGPPKGVEVRHRQLAASTNARFDAYERHPGRFGWTSSFGFDSSIAGLFWTLCAGGELVLPESGRHTDVDHLTAIIEQASVTHLLMVPGLWSAIVRRAAHAGRADALSSLTDVIVAGEAVAPEMVAAHLESRPDTALWNEYGPTEATVWATVHPCGGDEGPRVPIGRPIPGCVVRVAGSDLRARPVGVAGELLIGGAGVTDGYVDDPDGTSERFVVDPDDHGRRWYRSGDRCRVRPDGVIEFLGRLDDQLSVNGVRVEPAEIVAAVVSFPGVDQALVELAPTTSGAHLVGHVETGAGIDLAELRRHVGERVPSTVVPTRWVVHRSFVRTAHGKIDRAATLAAASEAGIAPRADEAGGVARPAAAEMVSIWRTVLDRRDLAPDSDFFDAGGNSLAAVELVIAIEERFGLPVTIGALLNARTPERLGTSLGIEVTSEPIHRRVVLAEGGPGPVLVHVPAWDDVFGYLPLRDAVDRSTDGSVRQLALQHRADDPDDPMVYVEALAERFAGDLDAAGDLDRPLVVLGWSTSGLVAYDLAQRLDERGAQIDAVVLVDTFFPGEERRRWANRLAKYAPLLKPGAFGEALRELRVTVRRRSRRLVAGVGRRLLRWADPDALAAASAPTRRVSTSNPDEAFEYQPAPTGLRVVLFAASTTSPRRTIEPWSAVCGRLEIVPVEGRHRGFDSVMGEDRVDAVAGPLVSSVLGGSATTREE